ncbi:hypothetical protein CCR75_007295 [Bremia lactucae]|uniref:Uncharacterized protein n=1 Tax=Bremia lactucae TaxID=4779 RepID=A0A976IGM5_BRELC|nr:hypothetical protein CCR75_007295 [Bremia lactucae]
MDFPSPHESDVEMMHTDTMLHANLAVHYGHPHHPTHRPLPPHPGIPSMSTDPQSVFSGVYVPGLSPMDQPPQSDAMEEYARLMGIKVENDDPHATAYGHHPHPHDVAKIQANAAYFENLINRDRNDAMDDGTNVTSMTLPAGIGSGMNGFLTAPMPPSAPLYNNPTSELAFHDGASRLYDPNSGNVFRGQSPPLPFHKGPQGSVRKHSHRK